jgi:hypothetical protein
LTDICANLLCCAWTQSLVVQFIWKVTVHLGCSR